MPGTMHSVLDDDGGVVDGGVFGAFFSEWKKVAAATAVGLAIFSGGVLMPAGSGDAATASMASSLMQDEKGYISIFEKVGYARGRLRRLGISLETSGVIQQYSDCTWNRYMISTCPKM